MKLYFEDISMKARILSAKNVIKYVGTNIATLCVIVGLTNMAHANSQSILPDCDQEFHQKFASKRLYKLVCQDEQLKEHNEEIKAQYLQAQLMSNAPLKLLLLSQQQWENFVNKCKTKACISQQFEQRVDELVYLTSMNQSLTQHFVRYVNGKVDPQFTSLQIQQLDRNRIKIEATQFRNPNNSDTARYAHLRSYTTADALQEISDLDSRCQYKIERKFSILKLESDEENCKRFTGIYKLYD